MIRIERGKNEKYGKKDRLYRSPIQTLTHASEHCHWHMNGKWYLETSKWNGNEFSIEEKPISSSQSISLCVYIYHNGIE